MVGPVGRRQGPSYAAPMLPHPILVAYDGRCPPALTAAGLLARLTRTSLTCVTAYRSEPLVLSGRVVPAPETDRRFAHAGAVARSAAVQVTGVEDVESHALAAHGGDVPKALVAMATDLDATAIVVGADLHGHVAHAVAAGATCPVLVVPEDPRLVSEGLRVVGVAFDGSLPSRLALTAAATMAEQAGATLRIVSVAVTDREEADAAAHADGALATGLPVHATTDVRIGDPGPQLRAASRSVDLMVCGARSRSRVSRSLLGSVSQELIDVPNCPVLVIPGRVARRHEAPLGLSTAGEAAAAEGT